VLLPPQRLEFAGLKTLVLDLDETLVHSSFNPTSDPDIVVSVEIQGATYLAYAAKRPGVDMFLAHLADKFEVVIFTASLPKVQTRQYADPLIDFLDTYSVVSSRLFRDSCVLVNGNFVKDLSRLGRDLSQVVIIDVTSKAELPNLLQPTTRKRNPCGVLVRRPE
jgi:RNA polymerase II subunit A small phosphatase-like protein